jgi:DNA transformation protein
MAAMTEFARLVLDLLDPVGEVRARAMFGGFGIYQRETAFAIIVGDRLYFKTDDATRRTFTKLGLGPFTYAARGRTVAMQYHEAPPDVFESPEVMQSYALAAIGVARRAAGRKRKRSG